MSIHFLSFGNEMYKNSIIRIANEIKSTNMVNYIHTYNEFDLMEMPEFWEKHKKFILSNKRGYGYWLWKSFLTLKTLNEMNEGDILIYADAGCEILINNRNQFNNSISLLNNDNSGFISFEMRCNLEKIWTKSDLFQHLNCFDLKDTAQLHATYFIIKKCENSMNIVEKWYEISSIYSLLDDTPSNVANDISFIEHRHDQSILSLLRKLYNTTIIKENDFHNFNFIRESRIRN
jgi:hypothetical protein